ncbi:MAG: DUF4145 domain-containing protein [Candidatus Paceibacterota bacterium]
MTFKHSSGKIISDTPCPHCNKQSTYEELVENKDYIREKTLVYGGDDFYFPYSVVFTIYQCEHCDRLRLIVEKERRDQYSSERKTILEFPFPGFSEIDREKIKYPIILENLDEGMRCLAANSPKGAIVNFRRALQSAVLILGGKGDTLEKQVDDLYKKEIIRSKTKEIAHKVRAFGNLGAHPFEIKVSESGEIQQDAFSELTIEDAMQAAKILVLFLEDALIYPSKLDAVDQRLDELKT